MNWREHAAGSTTTSWWLENDSGFTQAYVVHIKDSYLTNFMPHIGGVNSKFSSLTEAKEYAITVVALQKLEGT